MNALIQWIVIFAYIGLLGLVLRFSKDEKTRAFIVVIWIIVGAIFAFNAARCSSLECREDRQQAQMELAY